MRLTTTTLLLAAVLGAAAPGQNHDETYLVRYFGAALSMDGSGNASTLYTSLDLGRVVGHGTMDADNRHVFAYQQQYGFNSLNWYRPGLMRIDPATRTGSMFFEFIDMGFADGTAIDDAILDYNGDYLLNARRRWTNRTDESVLLRIDAQGNATTLLRNPSSNWYVYGAMGIDVATGHLMMRWGPNTAPRHVLVDVETGTIVGPWATYVWHDQLDELPQNHRTGALEYYYPARRQIRRTAPGQTTFPTTLATLPIPLETTNGIWDLQTAPRPRQLNLRYTGRGSVLYAVDTTTWTVTSVATNALNRPVSRIAFYQGRHTQTVRTAPGQWDVRFSAPKYAGKRYAVAISLAGHAPGIPLPDGRRINMAPDIFTALSGFDRLRPYWQPGPGVLDGQGDAVGKIDLSFFRGPLGAPLWISWVVLDPQAPGGIAYIPDVYVMRV